MTNSQKRIVALALASLRDQYTYWLSLRHTTDSERQLATTNIELIDEAAAALEMSLPEPPDSYPEVYAKALVCNSAQLKAVERDVGER